MKNKLDTLHEAGVINGDIHAGMLQVIAALEHLRGTPLPQEQGWMAIAHLASALMRSLRGEVVAPLDQAVIEELEASGEMPRLRALNQQLLARFPVELHPNEEGYLLVNLYGLCPGGDSACS
ncbi:hypothetical protein [Shimwellia blattae]|uniref:PRD domain-containing protein n=1 Tax=Shimwellia blattae (strain ATCC 29907 / DSM 4481 / JCM 1650 / NBRC 105725 / CDC 9005-74) TaxID=630626 RepID=I2B9Z3_SHIBC|nr:hypothetical protein [Shimwellia blattae]AFJ47347.1 hypothetical protein EBL_c22560 [Shimwellia blattae DSM 4481 = NBRC 105725]GAB80459.1 hypothetical protein YhfY [Shimwellia blattae DSM 4481 = NBRC 105725]VDY64843.1 Uncharacterised protein [Shimwellia blattae]VEC22964.1 Uncharacterised protein [Shimwellia blattae]